MTKTLVYTIRFAVDADTSMELGTDVIDALNSYGVSKVVDIRVLDVEPWSVDLDTQLPKQKPTEGDKRTDEGG